MPDEIDAIIDGVLKREKGYVDNPADRGGPTNMGITLMTLAGWCGHAVTAEDVRALTEDVAREIYRVEYVVKPKFHLITDPALRARVVDAGVMSHPRLATKLLQRALGVTADGILGEKTRAALEGWQGKRLVILFLAERVRFFGELISGDLRDQDKDGIPDNTEFARGWLNRTADQFEEVA